ncbi:MAG: YihY/virulence factor BrkB family protein [Acidobacteria bacterium]|nr:YihY/virulence factor BrkB family protein [Acidobacteriota bacterium]
MAGLTETRWMIQGRRAIQLTYAAVKERHTSQLAAGLSYYFILSFFPLLITFAAALALVPIPGLFDQILLLMARFVPPDSMGLVRAIIRDVISPHEAGIFSVGLVGTAWAASGGVAALIEAVNVAYDSPDTRSFVRQRALAVGLMLGVGILTIVALSLLVVGPAFGRWLADKIGLGAVFVASWPYLRWFLSISCAVLSIELIYTWAPAQRPSFRSTLPGAVIALATWLALSTALGVYLRNFGKLNRTYGTLAAAVALMLWLYWTGFAILVGAHFNAESTHATQTLTPVEQRPKPRPATAA